MDTKPGTEAASYSHSGERYVLGWGVDYFGIWDRTAPGSPMARFPRTDAGWKKAWSEFTAKESRFVEVRPGWTASAQPSTETSAYQPAGTLAKVVTWMVGAVGLLAALTMAARAGLIARLHEYQRGAATRGNVLESGDAVDAMAVVTVIAILATAVVWIIWQHRAHSNLSALRITELRFSPVLVVMWWLIPVANFVMPLFTTADLWRASDPTVRGAEWREKPFPVLLVVWWLFWIARIPLGAVAAAMQEQTQTAERLLTRAYIGLAVDTTIIVSAAFAIAIVRGIQRRQDAAAAALGVTAAASAA